MDKRKNIKEESNGKLKKIRQRLQEELLDAYLVLSSDFHNSEYVGEFFKCREYISGFTGSAGSLVILKNKAGLWTDGRYFLQAEEQLEGSGFDLFRMGEENVPTISEYLEKELSEHACVGMDGRTMSLCKFRELEKKLRKKRISVRLDYDLIGEIWQDRPLMSCEPAWELQTLYAGLSRTEKIKLLRCKLKEKEAVCSFISSLDDIAWTLNVRGADVACTPVVLSFLYISTDSVIWFVQSKAVSASLAEKLKTEGVTIRDYSEIYKFISEELRAGMVYLDPNRTNVMLYNKIMECMKKTNGNIIEGPNLTLLPKSIKNSVEIKNMRVAHIKDAIACIKLIIWLKKQMFRNTEQKKDSPVTELSVAEKLEEFRKEQNHYLGPSFQTIVGYAKHGAVIHYSASEQSSLLLRPDNFVLIDSGGHYLEGTTDITRTIALGTLTEKQKHYYTLVLKGNLKLADAKFKYGCAGINLDYLARESMWKEGLDYNHGTGHGVGYLLSVHEPPNSFRSRVSESGDECTKLEAGMITSNEPGIYITEAYGIRLENLMVCLELEKNKYGRFMGFDTLTLVPFERDTIIVDELDQKERELLNSYHAKVYQTISPYLNCEEQEWLRQATMAV